MGITYYEAKRMCEARRTGTNFSKMVSVAHQQLFLHPAELRDLRSAFCNKLDNYRFGEYIDRYCSEFLGVDKLDTIDYSPYEGATLIHDMNQPVPESWHGCYDAVLEAGSLEHIFNFPVAMSNLMRMTKVGGTIFMSTVANNLCGHGFYQFSPELMYRIFSAANGFEISRVVLLEATSPWVELQPFAGIYEVKDPATVGERVGLCSSRPVMMSVEARKISDAVPFTSTPQQSDYTVAWSGERESGDERARGGVKEVLKSVYRTLPETWQKDVEAVRATQRASFENTSFYRKIG